ncbi:hypothetical protein GW915_11790 [bacterium]|nr:hypothetical protein [bacterium]
MDSKQALNLLRKSGIEPALPFLIFSEKNGVEYANERMVELLRPIDNKLDTQDDLERVWPFFNEFQSPLALFKEITSAKFREDEDKLIYGEAFLKTFKIHVRRSEEYRIIACEMVRSGDLLADEEARQVLFRSISHEIRTATMTLRGYTEMLEDKCAEVARLEIEGLKNSLRRLDGVVRRLDDFKAELKVELEEVKQKPANKKKAV